MVDYASPLNRVQCWTLAIMLTFTQAAHAASTDDQAERPTPFVGYRMTYQGRILGIACGDWKVTEIKADGNVLSQCKNYVLESSGREDFNLLRLSTVEGVKLVEFLPFAPALKFPLAVGKSWQGKYTAYTADNGLVWDGSSDCKITAYETVKVVAGELQAFKIECIDKWQVGPRSGLTHTTRWYAPEAAVVVKSLQQEDPDKWNFELTSFGLADAAPGPIGVPEPDTGVGSPVGAPAPDNLEELAPILDPDDY